MSVFMNFERTTSPNLASGRTSRFSAARRRDICSSALLGTLGAVLRTALFAVLHALGIERAANDVVTHAGQILDAPASDHHHRVLLQVMALARDVAHHLVAVGETHLGHLAQGRVGLLGRRRIDARADAALLRAGLQRGHLVARAERAAALADQLVNGRHRLLFPNRRLGLGSALVGAWRKANTRASGKSAVPARIKLCGPGGPDL